MITLDTFKANIVPLDFFANNEDLENYYNTFASGFYEISGCFLQKGFLNYSLITLNTLNNPTIMNELIFLKPNLTELEMLNTFEEDFLILLTDLYFFEHEGVYHVADMFIVDENDSSIISLKEENFFLQHLLKRSVSSNSSEKFVRKLFNRVVNSTDTSLSEAVRMFIVVSFLEKLHNKPQDMQDYFNADDKKYKFAKVIRFYISLYYAIKNNEIVTGLMFTNIISLEYYTYFFDNLRAYNTANHLVDCLRLDV